LIFKLPNYQVTQLPNSLFEQSCLDRNENKILVTDGITATALSPFRIVQMTLGPRGVTGIAKGLNFPILA